MYNFQNVTWLQWVKISFGEGPVCANFTDTHRWQFYWIYNGYFHLKFKHVNKSHLSFKGFIVNKSWRLFQMYWLFFTEINCPVSGHKLCTSLVSPPQCPTPTAQCVPRVIFAPLAAGQAKVLITCPTPSRCTVVNPGQSKCTDCH